MSSGSAVLGLLPGPLFLAGVVAWTPFPCCWRAFNKGSKCYLRFYSATRAAPAPPASERRFAAAPNTTIAGGRELSMSHTRYSRRWPRRGAIQRRQRQRAQHDKSNAEAKWSARLCGFIQKAFAVLFKRGGAPAKDVERAEPARQNQKVSGVVEIDPRRGQLALGGRRRRL
jgi:hypothetical protein